MATLVLSGAGSAIAGPLGSAVGTLIGRNLDRSLRGTNHGKLGDLRVQSSQYGTEIPALHGRLRVAGIVVWATDLVESTAVAKSGARRSYSVSFAVALSCRQLTGIGRIWADGRLIRGEAGDHKIPFVVRHYHGGEDQEVDALIGASEGLTDTPAYRGVGMLVFEDFDLSTFGNRVPQIAAEIEADSSALQPAGLLSELANLSVFPTSSPAGFEGLAVQGDSKDVCFSQISDLFKVPFSFGQQGWQIGGEGTHHHIVEEALSLAPADPARGSRRSSVYGERPPTAVSLRYFDPALDFACGEKSARIPGPVVLRRIEFAGAITSDQAKALAQAQLKSDLENQHLLTLRLPISCAAVALGDVITPCDTEARSFAVVEKRIEGGEVHLLLSEVAAEEPPLPSEAGSRRKEEDLRGTALSLRILEWPLSRSRQSVTVAVAVAGGSNPWRAVQLEVTCGGTSQEGTSARREGGIGVALNGLGVAPSDVIDERHVLTVAFEDDPMLSDVSAGELLAGANLAAIGDEVVQFGRAEPKGNGVYELRRLLRGRLGTFPILHPQGAPVTLISAERLATFELPLDSIGAPVTVRAFGVDGTSLSATITLRGGGIVPWSPAHLQARARSTGLQLSWISRSMSGMPWVDYVDSPSEPYAERYVVVLTSATGALRREPTRQDCHFSTEELAVLGARPWQVEVRQIGDFGQSAPATSTIN